MTGRRTDTVYDGPKVLAAAAAFHPDVILLDIGLPGMSGYEVARQLRADSRFSRTVLIAVTGWGSSEDRQRSREAGFDDHLTKPIDLAALDPLLDRVTPTSAPGSLAG
jgi:CheY-like chemotaxis protein